MYGLFAQAMPALAQAGQGLMNQAGGAGGATGSTFGNAISGSAPNLAQRPEGNMFAPIKDDTDFMTRMQAGEFDAMESNPEMSQGVMQYLNTAAPTGDTNWTKAIDQQLGLSANKDMSMANQATPLSGLMGMAQTGQRQPQYNPYPVQQGLMNPWGG